MYKALSIGHRITLVWAMMSVIGNHHIYTCLTPPKGFTKPSFAKKAVVHVGIHPMCCSTILNVNQLSLKLSLSLVSLIWSRILLESPMWFQRKMGPENRDTMPDH